MGLANACNASDRDQPCIQVGRQLEQGVIAGYKGVGDDVDCRARITIVAASELVQQPPRAFVVQHSVDRRAKIVDLGGRDEAGGLVQQRDSVVDRVVECPKFGGVGVKIGDVGLQILQGRLQLLGACVTLSLGFQRGRIEENAG